MDAPPRNCTPPPREPEYAHHRKIDLEELRRDPGERVALLYDIVEGATDAAEEYLQQRNEREALLEKLREGRRLTDAGGLEPPKPERKASRRRDRSQERG